MLTRYFVTAWSCSQNAIFEVTAMQATASKIPMAQAFSGYMNSLVRLDGVSRGVLVHVCSCCQCWSHWHLSGRACSTCIMIPCIDHWQRDLLLKLTDSNAAVVYGGQGAVPPQSTSNVRQPASACHLILSRWFSIVVVLFRLLVCVPVLLIAGCSWSHYEWSDVFVCGCVAGTGRQREWAFSLLFPVETMDNEGVVVRMFKTLLDFTSQFASTGTVTGTVRGPERCRC